VAYPNLWVPPDLFRQQLEALVAGGWHAITMARLAADMEADRPPIPRSFVITIDDGHEDEFTGAFPVLTSLHLVATYYVVTGRLGEPGDLTREQVARLAAAGMEIGDHTVDHVNLARLTGAALQLQIVEAADVIQSIVGERPATFAYPFSDWNANVVAAVARAGFSAAAINRELGPEDWSNRFLLPRLEVDPGTAPAVLLALAESIAAAHR
jgi:peptidoglycan/xylan/chitin deacetylase (PgdA/CDA1 family)